MNRGLWNASLWFLILGGLAAGAGALLLAYTREKEVLKGHVQARVVELKLKEDRGVQQDGAFQNKYYPVFEFYTHGRLYKLTYPEGSYPSAFTVGQKVWLDYDPADPETFRIREEVKLQQWGRVLQAAGLALAVLGIFFFLRYAGRS